ncbi:MAG: VOC family protein [Bacteroidetes bacterium]|nr:VOC family protein [Bacteroidota bacterium]
MIDLKINHLQHIGLPIQEINRSRLFYESLGFQCIMKNTFRHEDGEGQVVMMKYKHIILELYQMPFPEKDRRDGKIDHIAFDVSNIDETYNLLKEAGFSPVEKEPVHLPFWEKGCKYFYILGPDGERLEFCQILK